MELNLYYVWDAPGSNMGSGNIEYTMNDFTCSWNTVSAPGTSYDVTLNYYDNSILLVGVVIHVVVLEALNADFSLLTSPACPSEEVCFSNTSAFPANGPAVSAFWNFGDGQTTTSCLGGAVCNTTICHTYDFPGTYTVTLALDNVYCQSIKQVENGGASYLTTAVSENNGINPIVITETKSKIINDILLSNLQNNQILLDAAQLSVLRGIANECPFEQGVAVYEARMLVQPYDNLLTVYENPCETEQEGRIMNIANTNAANPTATEFIIYPNPNAGTFTLNYVVSNNDKAQLVIYDLSGRRIKTFLLSSSQNVAVIENAELSNGVYMYSIIVNEQIAQTDKLVIVK